MSSDSKRIKEEEETNLTEAIEEIIKQVIRIS